MLKSIPFLISILLVVIFGMFFDFHKGSFRYVEGIDHAILMFWDIPSILFVLIPSLVFYISFKRKMQMTFVDLKATFQIVRM